MSADGNKFFKYVGRLAILLSVSIMALVLLGIVWIYAESYKNRHREQVATDLVNIGKQTKLKEKFILGNPQILNGTDYAQIPFLRKHSNDGSYSDGTAEVNFLILNCLTGESKWLAQSTKQVFVSNVKLLEKMRKSHDNTKQDDNKVVRLVYSVSEQDSSRDGQLNRNDASSVTTSSVDGSDYKTVIENIDRLYLMQQNADNKMVIFYQKGKDTVSEIYEISSMKRLSQTVIPQVNLN